MHRAIAQYKLKIKTVRKTTGLEPKLMIDTNLERVRFSCLAIPDYRREMSKPLVDRDRSEGHK